MTTSSKSKPKQSLIAKSKAKITATNLNDENSIVNEETIENNKTNESSSNANETENKETVSIDPTNKEKESESKSDEDFEIENDENDEVEEEDDEDGVEKLDTNESIQEGTEEQKKTTKTKKSSKVSGDYVNPRGVRFIQETSSSATGSTGTTATNAANTPYGLPCVRELLRFLISLINTKNADLMISMGLNLITIGLESGIDYISSYQSLLAYVKDDLLKNLYQLLSTERMAQYASVLRVSFLLFESLRSHLKLQMEHFLNKLMDICLILSPNDFAVNSLNGEIGISNSSVLLQQPPASTSSNKSNLNNNKQITQEQKEMTIDYFLQMLRIPGFAVEIYLNYDCSLNCSNLFENLTKLLSKVKISKFIIYGSY
jgi:brefeldin A-resistance guanine nucleotide exchange factor 1